jgi:aryl-alcohol dehydrogenase-like predicted oxidoreductase
MVSYRRLGRTGLMVSAISLGTVELGMNYGIPTAGEHLRPSEKQASHLLNRALDMGVNFVDTARIYGESEAVIGRALKSRREEYILATKVALSNDASLTDREIKLRAKESLAESLRTLHTDVIDLLQIHSASVEVIRRGAIIEAIQEAQQEGKVRFTGATTYGEEAALAVIEDGRYDCLQVAYNLLDRGLETKVLPLAQHKDMGIVARSVLLRGVLTHRYTSVPPQLAELKTAIHQLSGLVGPEVMSLPEMAYRFVLAHPAVATALVGTARLDELEEGLNFSGRDALPFELIERIRQIAVHDQSQLNPATWPPEDVWQAA